MIGAQGSPGSPPRRPGPGFWGAALAGAVVLATAAARGVFDPYLLAAAVCAAGIGFLIPRRARMEARGVTPPASVTPPVGLMGLLDHVPDAVILTDARFLVVQANEAARRLLPGLRSGRPISLLLRAPQVRDAMAEVRRSGTSTSVDYAERGPAGRTFDVHIELLHSESSADGPQLDGAGQGLVLVLRDISEARRLDRMRADFVANASHELRTPLASLMGFIDTLQGAARDDAEARARFLSIMRAQARRMARLIDDLLSLSQLELRAHQPPTGRLDVVPVARQVVDLLAPLAAEAGVEIGLDVPAGPLTVAGDHDELTRAIENLVENGIKYGASGGRVQIGLASNGGSVTVAVRDWGPGIAREHLPRLTERFYRADAAASREKGGTGLGLSIVKHILAHHRGRLTIDSRPGEGATFTMVLPRLASGDALERHPTVTQAP